MPMNDCAIIMHAIGGQGVALIGGTGQNAIGYRSDGTIVKIGGWGHLLGDQGSGFFIGKSAINDAIFIADGRWNYSSRATIGSEDEKQNFIVKIFDYFGISENERQTAGLEAIVPLIYTHKDAAPKKIAGLARIVCSLAKDGNAIALNLVDETVADITQVIAAMFSKLAVREEKVVLVGGLYNNSDAQRLILDPVRARLAQRGLVPKFIIFSNEPPELLLEAARHSAIMAFGS